MIKKSVDTASPINNIISSFKKYVVPTRRNDRKKQHVIYGKEATNSFVADVPISLIAPEEVKPTFRTPCGSIMVGSISIKI